MELFPDADEEQFAFIKRVINDCDYYLLIIGGRYGSVDTAGVSYTEKEFDYAVSRGLRVVALIHENPRKIAMEKCEEEPAQREKLEKFKTKVSTGRLVKLWNNAAELPALVAVSLQNTIRAYPAVGWIRANKAASEDLLSEINDLRKKNAHLEQVLIELQPVNPVKDLAGLDEGVTFTVKYRDEYLRQNHSVDAKTSWRKIFGYIAPYVEKYPSEHEVRKVLAAALLASEKTGSSRTSQAELDDQTFLTVGVQLKALGLVKITYSPPASALATVYGPEAGIWSLTPAGEQLMFEVRAIRTSNK